MQLIRFMKSEELLLKSSINDLRWLCDYYKIKPSNRKRIMIHQLLSMNKKENLCECPICYDKMDFERTVITPCGHAFCDSCILTYLQKRDECPLCRSYFTVIYLLLIIPKDRIIEIYQQIYTTSIGEPVYYCQQITGERLHPNGYLFDREDIRQENDRRRHYDFCQNNFIFMVIILLFIKYIITCLNTMIYTLE